MLLLPLLLASADQWPIDTPRDRCVFFADETSSPEDQTFAQNSAYLPQDAFSEVECRRITLLLAQLGFEPLIGQSDTTTLRGVWERAFSAPTRYEVTWESEPEDATLVWTRGTGSDAQSGREEIPPRVAARILEEVLTHTCHLALPEHPGQLDGESWTFEFADQARYCFSREHGDAAPLAEALAPLMQIRPEQSSD